MRTCLRLGLWGWGTATSLTIAAAWAQEAKPPASPPPASPPAAASAAEAERSVAPPVRPVGFLISIAANLARRHLRSSKRRRAVISRLSDEPLAQVPRPDQSASDAELSLRLMRALDELPDKLRVSFVLVQIEERDASEVAVILGVPASTVRARVRAARARLQASRYLGSRKELA